MHIHPVWTIFSPRLAESPDADDVAGGPHHSAARRGSHQSGGKYSSHMLKSAAERVVN